MWGVKICFPGPCDRTASTVHTLLSNTPPRINTSCFCFSICVFVQNSRRRQAGVRPSIRRRPFPDKRIQKKRVGLRAAANTGYMCDCRDGEFSHTRSLLLTRRRRRIQFKTPSSNECEGQTVNLWPEDLQAQRNWPRRVLHFIYRP